MTQEIQKSLDLLTKDWDMDPTICDFLLGKITDISDYTLKVQDVIFHIPYLVAQKKYVLWKCYWPDCHNCCDRQGRLPLTYDDLITIGAGLKYKKTSDFIKNETNIVTYQDPLPSSSSSSSPTPPDADVTTAEQATVMTTINLKRKTDETPQDDGTHISCRFLDKDGGCSMHPTRPGVCYLYPFSSWLVNEGGKTARVHASYQFTGDCPGFYLADALDVMKKEFDEYSKIIYDYTIKFNATTRAGFGISSFV